MKPVTYRLAKAATPRPSLLLLLGLACAPLAAQQGDAKPAPTPDPVKGWHEPTPMSPAEVARRTARANGQWRPEGAPAAMRTATSPQLPHAVLFDQPGDGRVWAAAPTYKASFGPDGFDFVPFFGSAAPTNHPVRFELQSVRVGGAELGLAAATPVLAGSRVTFDRGAVQERYDLRVADVEQTFVVDSAAAGDVVVTVRVVTELQEDAGRLGIQFANGLGCVEYGQAHVVDGARLHPVATTWENGAVRIHVPASLRGSGPLVVDPVIHTSAFTGSGPQSSSQPDIAYDATTDQYLVVWQYEYSATDTDVYCEFRNGDGTLVTGSLGVIDVSTLDHRNPRVANLNSYDRFLVVMQRLQGANWEIWGRLRLAGTTVHPILFPISDPVFSGHCVNPDIGGDPASSGTADNWLVVWERQFSATDFDIHARTVRADIAIPSPTILIENSGSTIYSLPSVSQSNGNGFATAARWLVAYQFRYSATDEDVYGCAIDQAGTVTTPNSAIDTSTLTDLVPSVSSPNTTAANGNPLFLVTYERQNPFVARARLLSGGFVNQIAPVDLSTTFGLGGFWVRAECDGNRFAVLNGAGTIGAATLAYTGSALVLQEATQPLPGIPSYARICSKRSGGGPLTDFGIAYVEQSTVPDRIGVSAYRGHAPGPDVTRRVMGCNGLQIDVAGRPYLGEALTFSLANVGFDVPGFVFGASAVASNVVCAPCPLGVSTAGAILVVGSSLPVAIPPTAGLVGVTAAVQGFALGSGPCVATLRFSDTLDFTIQ